MFLTRSEYGEHLPILQMENFCRTVNAHKPRPSSCPSVAHLAAHSSSNHCAPAPTHARRSASCAARPPVDRGVNTFSPEGRLFQVEYAIEAIKLGSTTIGIATSHGVVLGVEKRVQSSLLESSSIEKIMEIDTHLGAAMSGLVADARTMIDHARVTSQNHAFTYDEPIKVSSVTQAVCDLALRFGESTEEEDAMMSRPFGVALLIAGIDETGPQL